MKYCIFAFSFISIISCDIFLTQINKGIFFFFQQIVYYTSNVLFYNVFLKSQNYHVPMSPNAFAFHHVQNFFFTNVLGTASLESC